MSKIVLENDGTDKLPREVQIQTLNWIEDVWKNDKHLAISLQTGAGKSYIARTIQRATGAAIVTPSNVLVRQYIAAYPEIPYNIGKAQYKCGPRQNSCAKLIDFHHSTPCQDCCYAKAKKAVAEGKPCLYNPISLFFARKEETFKELPVIVVDEAHAVLSLLYTLNNEIIPFSVPEIVEKYKITDLNDLTNEYNLLRFLNDKLAQRRETFERYSHVWDTRKRDRNSKKIFTLENIIFGMTESAQMYSSTIKGNTIVIRCVKMPKAIIKRVFGSARLVVLSATLFKPDLEELFQGDEYDYLDLPSPIPKENRIVYARPTSFKINYMTEPQDIVNAVEEILQEYPNTNTLIHLPYSFASRVASLMKTKVITHDQDNKETQLEHWLKNGGVFVGSGVYEGLDLKDNLCRLNIIVKIPYPNLGDSVVKKRKALPDGELWYASESLKAVIQSVGRSTRTEVDYSDTYVLDPSFAGLVTRNYSWLPKSFTESIVWGRRRVRENSKVY